MIIMIIIIIAIISILLIYWLQYPELKENKRQSLCYKIFNKVKLPIFVLCIILIVYLSCSPNKMNCNINKINMDFSIPNF
jgi:hypothetical protein